MVGLLGLEGPWHLALDRTQWKLGTRDVNILELQKTLLRQKAILSTAGRTFEEEVHVDYRRSATVDEAFVGPAAGST